MKELIEASQKPQNISLATFKPRNIIGFEYEEERDWGETLKKNLLQQDLFDERGGTGDKDIVKNYRTNFITVLKMKQVIHHG